MKLLAIVFLFIGIVSITHSQTFTKITTGDIVTDGGASRGASFIDYNNDGYQDVYISNVSNQANFLYQNNGNGTFSSVNNMPLVNFSLATGSSAWADYNNDGFLDVFITHTSTNNLLFDGTNNFSFTQVLNGDIVNDNIGNASAGWADYDNDGHLDLFVAAYVNSGGLFPANNLLYHNNGNGTFTKVTTGDIVNDGGTSLGCSWADYNNDGLLDLFVCNTNGEDNFLYRNNGSGSFTKITTGDIVNDGGSSFSGVWGDYDNDGFQDLFVSNNFGQNNFLYQNNGNGTFTKITTGDIVTDGGKSNGADWGDLNNDGWVDLVVINGSGEHNYIYQNNGDTTFTKISSGAFYNNVVISQGTSLGDYNNDGFLDIVVVNNSNNDLFENNTNNNHWVNLALEGINSNRSAIGARVSIKSQINNQTVWQYKIVSTTAAYRSQSSLNVEFGIGNATSIDSMVIEWPSGLVCSYNYVPIDTFLSIPEICCDFASANFGVQVLGHVADFTDSSINASNYYWDFGDGNFSTNTNPQHTYLNPGTYTVCLTVVNNCSDSVITCKAISICAEPVVSFSGISNIDTATFTNSSTNASSYHWDFGDGNFSTNANPQHIYALPGIYNVCLTGVNDCGDSITTCNQIQICNLPTSSFSHVQNVMTVDFTSTSTGASSYFWDFGDGDTSHLQDPQHVFPTSGIFTVCHTAINDCNDSVTICTDVEIEEVSVLENSGGAPITLFPNPTSDYITIIGLSIHDVESLSIVDILGSNVTQNIERHFNKSVGELLVIDLTPLGLSPGTYFIQWQTAQNNGVERFIYK